MTIVETVRGPVDSTELGLTLFHEHLLNDVRSWTNEPSPDDPEGLAIAASPLAIGFLGRLRHDPFLCRDNCALDDVGLAVREVRRFTAVGGRTIVEQTCRGIGRDPRGLARISSETGVHVIMGSGYYLQSSHPPSVARMPLSDLAAEITADARDGCDGIRAGLIGEIGISADFTADEEKVLRAAGRAQLETRLPVSVHLPGWFRHAGRVLGILEEEGVPPRAVVLCHMNPSLDDGGYQRALADRGAWLSYDMIGMDFFYADQQAQSPCDEENARAVAGLVRDGYGDHLLLSGDTFLKMQLTAYGGLGYAHVPVNFAARLIRAGLTPDQVSGLLSVNPGRVFEQAASAVLLLLVT